MGAGLAEEGQKDFVFLEPHQLFARMTSGFYLFNRHQASPLTRSALFVLSPKDTLIEHRRVSNEKIAISVVSFHSFHVDEMLQSRFFNRFRRKNTGDKYPLVSQTCSVVSLLVSGIKEEMTFPFRAPLLLPSRS